MLHLHIIYCLLFISKLQTQFAGIFAMIFAHSWCPMRSLLYDLSCNILENFKVFLLVHVVVAI